jgi:linoleoyl-CoA desaturase
LGWLNFQAIHHLFPHISHIHYPQIARIVQRVCHEYGIPYHSYATVRSAFVSHVRHLKYLGRE